MKPKSYNEAGVNIKAGDEFAEYIASIDSPAVSRGIGGFASQVPLNLAEYSEPVVLTSTDGVGTKLLVARELADWSTVGIDLVAMCVNDLAACGARPLQFLDYIACGAIDAAVLKNVIAGVIEGCRQAGCVLGGGETAEMPDMYGADEIDLAGFVVGVVEKSRQLPRPEYMRAGDILYGLPSTGVHSNGLSLARKIVAAENRAMRQALLVPTRIYVDEAMQLCPGEEVKGAAHITGGGLLGNIRRVIPEHLDVELSWDWPVPDIFTHINGEGVDLSEMRAVFNMGIGFVFVVTAAAAAAFETRAQAAGIDALRIGRLETRRPHG